MVRLVIFETLDRQDISHLSLATYSTLIGRASMCDIMHKDRLE